MLLAPERRTADPSLRVAQLGMTETCSSHTWWPPHEQVPEAKRGSLGVSAPGYEHKVVDEAGREVPNGVTGEICVRGTAMMRGMVGRQWHELFDETVGITPRTPATATTTVTSTSRGAPTT